MSEKEALESLRGLIAKMLMVCPPEDNRLKSLIKELERLAHEVD